MAVASVVITILIGLVTFLITCRYVLFPFLFAQLSNLRVSAISFLSLKGLEYRPKGEHGSVIPTLRVERAGWAWGGLKDSEVGVIVLRIDKVVFRVKKRRKSAPHDGPEKPAKPPSRFAQWRNRSVTSLIHLLVHHYSSLTRLVSVEVVDLRIVFDDMGGVELTVKDLRAGVTVDFEGKADPVELPPVLSPVTRERAYPLASPPTDSPRSNPISFLPSFGSSGQNIKQGDEAASPAPATRQTFHSRVSSNASQIWQRAIARAHGSVSVAVAVTDIGLILPDANPPYPLSNRSSIIKMDVKEARVEGTRSSLSVDPKPRERLRSFTSMSSIKSWIQNPTRRVPSKDSGFERLMAIDGQSRLALHLGFGPKRGLLGEDTLKTELGWGSFRTSVGAVEKVQQLLGDHKQTSSNEDHETSEPAQPRWTPHAYPRILLRAFEGVAISFKQISLSHYLPTSDSHPVSAASSSTSISSAIEDVPEVYTVAFDIGGLELHLDAADSFTNKRTRNAFGTNASPNSKVRGVGFGLQWQTISLQCLEPGDKCEQRSQLLQIRSASFEGASTWRPDGWSREELLFASDPNLALIVGSGKIASVDGAVDIHLLDQLRLGYERIRKPSTPKASTGESDVKGKALLPRIRVVLDIGHIMMLVADSGADLKPTVTMESDGLHFGCFTNFTDIIARRNRNATKAAFKQEEELQQRREQADDEEDFAQPPPMLKPQYRRHPPQTPATLRDDYSISMKVDASLDVQPLVIHMNVQDAGSWDHKTDQLASIGGLHIALTGDVLGRQEVLASGAEIAMLDPNSRSFDLDIGIDKGIKVNLWNPTVLDALTGMAEANGPKSRPPPKQHDQNQPNLHRRLTSGVSMRLSFGLISVFVGHADPNPHCKMQLVRGLWLQTLATFEYAYYGNKIQALQSRHPLSSITRTKLRLPEDMTTQALSFFNTLAEEGGRAALFSFTLVDTFVKPIFHGEKFVRMGGTSRSHETAPPPKPRKGDSFVGWEFRRPKMDADPKDGHFSNNLPPLEMTDTEQAQRPLFRIPHAHFNWLVLRQRPQEDITYKLTGKVDSIHVLGDLSHIYCALLATLTVRRLIAAFKRPKPPQLGGKGSSPLDKLSISVNMPILDLYLVLPLDEHVFMRVVNIGVTKPTAGPVKFEAEGTEIYVPSTQEMGSFEQLGNIRDLTVRCTPPSQGLAFDANAEALRLRIPFNYQVSRLVLNVQLAVKTLKLLIYDMSSSEFSFKKPPLAEQPKHFPPISINVRHLFLEAKDNRLETKLNLIWRVNRSQQKMRNLLEDAFDEKMHAVKASSGPPESSINLNDIPEHGHHKTRFTAKMSTTYQDARDRLDRLKFLEWKKRIDAAEREQQKRERDTLKEMHYAGVKRKLPINVVPATDTAPLFRVALGDVCFKFESLDWSREEIIKWMGDVSAPFKDDVKFSLMLPVNLSWSFGSGFAKLRDYPLDLVRVPPCDNGGPNWKLETPFIIAEELQGDDSVIYIPSRVLPAGCGDKDAAEFHVQIAKTVMPVKTYARPNVIVSALRTTEFTWGNSYQPAIQDFMRVIDSLSHPPRDPSARIGFWDKFRLILHWKVMVDFAGPVHLHLKGTMDPYNVTGFGAGFALAWRGGTKFMINQPNKEFEVIQIESDELLIAIPDLSALHDGAAAGGTVQYERFPSADPMTHDKDLIARRYTKPCARFQDRVRVGFGFVFERTCRPWNCQQHCGKTENLMHRQCRITEFVQHQDIILRSPEAVERAEKELGHTSDSYEGLRSDFIHFSVSCVAPLNASTSTKSDLANSLHFSPKAFAHFFAWWKLFDNNMSLPVRQGKLFPDTPPPSRKFGKSLGTIKYRFDLKDVYLSHMYQQVAPDHWGHGKSLSLGMKAKVVHFRADLHQRAQERTVRHEKLHRTTVQVHKPFYAADILADGIQLKGINAEFSETGQSHPANEEPPSPGAFQLASELDLDLKPWYNSFDFIDADRKPFDKNPMVQIVDIGDCPHVFFIKRLKARQTTASDDDTSSIGSTNDSRLEMESSKFGHEKSHICYLGAAAGVGPTQIKLTKERIKELEDVLDCFSGVDTEFARDRENISGRLRTLKLHLEELSSKERRHIDDDTFQAADTHPLDKLSESGEIPFENTCHVHCPRVILSNESRNIIYKYYYSSHDRKKEEYATSHASLRGIRDTLGKQPKKNRRNGRLGGAESPDGADICQALIKELEDTLARFSASSTIFRLTDAKTDKKDEGDDLRKTHVGLPSECVVKPQNQFLVLKPQISLRSNVDEESIVLLALEELSYKSFAVIDETAYDPVAGQVLSRNYGSAKSLQAFYPTSESMGRKRGLTSCANGIDYLPLEIFMDVRSRATDYDRIVLKSDAAWSFDKFNHLNIPRGLDWPDVKDENGQEITHLRMRRDQTILTLPRLAVAATTKHYTTLYNVVTDLLIYQDPEHRQRSERIDSFTYAFDRKERDPQRLLIELFRHQKLIRNLSELERGYEANVDLLDDEGKRELFKIRTDLLEATEELFTVFEAVAVNQSRDKARASLKTASRMDVRIGGVSWHMLFDDLTPLAKLDIEGLLYSRFNNKDGSTDSAVVLLDLKALNPNHHALYEEILVRYVPGGARKRQKEPFASACWSSLAPVGGIPIVRLFAIKLHPVRFKLEEKVGHSVVDYIFNDRVKRRKAKAEAEEDRKKTNGRGNVEGLTPMNGNRSSLDIPGQDGNGTNGKSEMPPLERSRSQLSIRSRTTVNSRVTEENGEGEHKFTMIPTKDAIEMRRRATTNKTYIKIVISPTHFNLNYKGDDSKKHHGISMPDCVDFKMKSPKFEYFNKVWSMEDIFEHGKRDVRASVWTQSGAILPQILKNTSVFRSKKALLHAAELPSLVRSPSKLRYNVDSPSKSANDNPPSEFGAISRAISRDKALSRSHSRNERNEESSIAAGMSLKKSSSAKSDEDDDDESKMGVGKTVKGFFGKLRSRHHSGRSDSGSFGSHDELSAMADRSITRHGSSLSSSSSSRDHSHVVQ